MPSMMITQSPDVGRGDERRLVDVSALLYYGLLWARERLSGIAWATEDEAHTECLLMLYL